MTQVARKLRTPEDYSRFRLALTQVDQAFRDSEEKWGVSRLERLISLPTLRAYERGWDAYRIVLEECDGEGLEVVGPKMIAALAFMDREATAAGHAPLAPETWEAPMVDGTVLVVVRSNAEASAVLRDAARADGMMAESGLPLDVAVTIRHQHDGRRLTVWTMAEIARLIERHGSVTGSQPEVAGKRWEGTAAPSGVQGEEGLAADLVRSGYPLPGPIAVSAPSAVLDF